MLWAPTAETISNADLEPQSLDQAMLASIDQALPISSMMRQIGAAMTQGSAISAPDVEPIAALLADAVLSDDWYVIQGVVLQAAVTRKSIACGVQVYVHITYCCNGLYCCDA